MPINDFSAWLTSPFFADIVTGLQEGPLKRRIEGMSGDGGASRDVDGF